MDFCFSLIVATATETIDTGAICDVFNPEIPNFLPLQLRNMIITFRFNFYMDKEIVAVASNVDFKLKYLLIKPPTQSGLNATR